MSARDRFVGFLARAGLFVVRGMILHLPDWVMGKLLRAVEWQVFVATGDRMAAAAVAEVADIFESGPPFTTTVRKLMQGAEPEVVAGAITSLTKPSPYGSA